MVMASVIDANPVRDVQPVRSKSQPKGAVALTADQLRDLLMKLQTSGFCEKARPRRSDQASDREAFADQNCLHCAGRTSTRRAVSSPSLAS